MANSLPFNAVAVDGEYDRVYKAEDWAWYFATFIANGIFPKPSDGLQVVAYSGMEIRVNAGYAFINGYAFRNPATLSVTLDTAEGAHTVVMSLMNGVDSEERIAAEVGDAHVIRSLIKVVSHKEADGFHFDPDATLGIIFGEQEAPFQSERVQAIVELIEGSGIHYRVTEHIREEMWAKFRLNVCNNLPQAILGAGVGCYRDSVHMQAISDGLRRELEAVARDCKPRAGVLE